jgi:hypothetical protein
MREGYETWLVRETLDVRSSRAAWRYGLIRQGMHGAPGNRRVLPAEDISGTGIPGFALTGGDQGGFETAPENS